MTGSVGSPMEERSSFLRKLLVILCILPAFLASKGFADVPRKPVVIITVDAESVNHEDRKISLPKQFDLKINGVSCGITKIMDICDRHKVKSTFFLNVYEYKKYGEKPLKNIATLMDHRGFDVELHTHPQWAYDQTRNLMYQYTLKEQIGIIEDGKNLLKKWINKEPIIHRAGAYSADENTLQALRVNHIYYDSSFRYGYPTCLLQDLGLKKNYISLFHEVYEIPVNLFHLERSSYGLSLLAPLNSITKYDIDSVDAKTLMKAIDKAIEHRFDVIVLFLHSSTFIKAYTKTKRSPDVTDIAEFDTVLKYIRTRGLPVMTFRAFISKTPWDKFDLGNSDSLPIVHTEVNMFKFLGKKAGLNRGNIQQAVMVTGGIVIILLVVLIFTLRKNRNA